MKISTNIMRPLCFYSLLFGNVYIALVIDAASFSSVHWSTAIKLSEYEGFRSATLQSFSVPEQSVEVSFSFQVKTSGRSCPFREVHIYLQHGSYPLVRPYNETLPPKFYADRTDWFHIVIKRDAEVVTYTLPTPRPGLWYMAAFLPKPVSDKIQQKGFDKSCMYGMFVVVDSSGVDDVHEISTYENHNIRLSQQAGSESVLYRLKLPEDTVEYTTIITDCTVAMQNFEDTLEQSDMYSNISADSTSQNLTSSTMFNFTTTTSKKPSDLSSSCPLTLILDSEKMPSLSSESSLNCGNISECQLTVISPNIKGWNYVLIQIDQTYNISDIQFKLGFSHKVCQSAMFMLPKIILKATRGLSVEGNPLMLKSDDCVKVNSLGRFILDDMTYNITYLFSEMTFIPIPGVLENIQVPDYEVLVTNIVVQEFTDIGGTLKLYASLNVTSFDASTHQVVINLCLMKNSIPSGQNVRSCTQGVRLHLNSTSACEDVIYVPYPEPGSWYLGLNSQCFDKSSMTQVHCPVLPEIYMEIGISGCIEGQCGEYGVCQDYVSGVNVFSSCKCLAGWSGYGCTDGTHARSRQHELLALLLLTLSNLFFIPSIILAATRRYFVEAGVYTYTMFFSTFYHACDASNLIYYCMLDYDVLSFADFLSSILSFWVTLLVMSEIPSRLRSFGQTIGALGVAVGVQYDRHGLWVFAVPAGLAAIIMFTSWVVQCKKHRRLYPDKKYFLIHLVPGVVLAVTGLVLFAFFETEENYMYTHSAWHIAMSLSIVFLLPRRRNQEIKQEDTDSTETVLTDVDTSETHLCLQNQPV